jgi:hypothetical protein
MLIPFQPPPGLVSDDTTFASPGRYADASMVRWYEDTWQVQGGWESLTTDLLSGVCRNIFQWSDNTPTTNVAFGTNSDLQVWLGGGLYTITPTLALPAITLPSATPIATSNGTPTIVVTWTGHPLIVGDIVVISGATAVATVTINGTWTVTAVTANTFTFTAGSNASATTTGGGSAVVVTPQRAYAAGAIDGTGGAGYGTGAYGVGTYGSPSTADYFPRTWALSAYGQSLIANYRQGPIYQWSNNTGTRAQPVANSPPKVIYALAMPQRQVMAFGCNQEADGVFNAACIRWSDIENINDWTTSASNNAGEYILEGGGRIVGARLAGDFVFVWTDNATWLGQYIGDPGETWRFTKSGTGGLIGPNAAVVVGQTGFWVSADAQFYSCTVGNTPTPMDCPIRKSFADNIAVGQFDKIVAASIASFREIRWFYPDARDGYENSRDLSITAGGLWMRGQLARTAFCDAGPSESPIGATYAGNAYWHEKGTSADGGKFSWFIESTDFYLDEDAANMMVNGVFPNFKDQLGGISLSLIMREHPQATERTKGPYVLAPNLEKKSFRASGRVARVRMEGNSSPVYARMGKLEFDV